MSGLVNPAGAASSNSRTSAAAIGALKDVLRSALGLSADATVLIQELSCRESGCAPVETVIAELGATRRVWKFAKPAADVCADEVRAAIIDHPEGDPHDNGR